MAKPWKCRRHAMHQGFCGAPDLPNLGSVADTRCITVSVARLTCKALEVSPTRDALGLLWRA